MSRGKNRRLVPFSNFVGPISLAFIDILLFCIINCRGPNYEVLRSHAVKFRIGLPNAIYI